MHSEFSENDPVRYSQHSKNVDGVNRSCSQLHGEDIGSKEQALFETTAEVVIGICQALEDYEQGNQSAWTKAS